MDYKDMEIEKLSSVLEDREKYWNETINGLSKKLSCSAKEVIPVQAEVISLRQELSEEIKKISYEVYKYSPVLKLLKKQRFEYYHTTYPIATNASEKAKLIEWDIAKYTQKENFMDVHIEFLRESLKNIDNLNYAIKNKISLYQLTDME